MSPASSQGCIDGTQDRVHAAAPVHDGGRPHTALIPGGAVRSRSGIEESEWL
jgi:hypothetical protein